MLYRLVSITIVVFWGVMTALLVRNEINPGASSLREVPVSHVLKQLFTFEQRSNLRIFNGSTPIGHLFMYPHVDPETEARVLEFTGTLQFDVGPNRKQRVSWDAIFRMNSTFEMQESEYRIRMHDPGDLLAEIRTDARNPRLHVRLSSKDQIIQDMEIPLNRSGLEGVAQQFGATGDVLNMIQQPAAAKQPTIRARQSSIRLGHDQRTETFLVTIEQNGQTFIECHFSQLGQALKATSIFGYTLRDELLP